MSFAQVKNKLLTLFSIDEFTNTVKRFPLSALCCAFCFLIGTVLLFEIVEVDDDLAARSIVVSIVGFFWCGIVRLFFENHISSKYEFLFSVVGVLFFCFIIFFEQKEIAETLFLIVLSLVVLVGSAPFIFKKSDNLSFWSFNRQLGFGVGVSFLAAFILFAGASAAMKSIELLFEVNISEKIYFLLWLVGATVVAPIYALSFVPKKFTEDNKKCNLPEQIGFIANWILAPLVAIYLAILYAYFIKILINWELPRGHLSFMIFGFALAGLITYQTSWPFIYVGKANRLLRWLMNKYFILLAIPIVMQFVAIGIRIYEYGITQKRYIILLGAVWLSFLVGGFVLKKLQLKHITISFAVLLFFASWGPWGMNAVSNQSQIGRFHHIMNQYDLVEEGKLIRQEKRDLEDFDVQKDLSSVVDYIVQNHKDDQIRQEILYSYKNREDFFEALGIEYISQYEIERSENQVKNNKFHYYFGSSDQGRVVPLWDRFYVIRHAHFEQNKDIVFSSDELDKVTLKLSENKLNIRIPDKEMLDIDLSMHVEELLNERQRRGHANRSLVIAEENRDMRVRYEMGGLSGDMVEKRPQVTRMNGSLHIFLK